MITIPKFENVEALYLLLLLALYIVWYIVWGAKRKPTLQISSIMPFKKLGKGFRYYIQHLPFVLRCFVLTLLIIAIARPRSREEFEQVNTEGIDIILSLDVSSSMLARDFKPDRISAAKDIAIQFVAERPSDRIGVVVFAGESFVQCPLTTDRAALINLIKDIETDLIEDGTAIGNGLATAINRLCDSDAKSRVIILLTDGVNTRGEVAPITAADIAKMYDIRVYTIGVGANGMAPYPLMTPYGIQMQQITVEIDEALLKEIAQLTGGQYFRATDNTKLLEIYKEINQMEKNKTMVDSFPIYKEEFMPFALAAFALLIVELLLKLFVLRRIP
ncbi:MAG: VWA domain-containing protein [Prevotellaceae bacterium]|jgi:Ca-activated chloride channel family protein|nr:VWA domain-containing protein [Prevotellaceae bacterium]